MVGAFSSENYEELAWVKGTISLCVGDKYYVSNCVWDSSIT